MEENNNPIKEMGSSGQTGATNNYQANQGNVANKKTNNMALVSFIASLIGLIIAGIPCGMVAIITGIMGLVKFNKETEKCKWMAVTGIIIGVIDVVVVALSIVLKTMNALA